MSNELRWRDKAGVVHALHMAWVKQRRALVTVCGARTTRVAPNTENDTAVTCLACFTAHANRTMIHVGPYGDDLLGDGSEQRPYRTAARANLDIPARIPAGHHYEIDMTGVIDDGEE